MAKKNKQRIPVRKLLSKKSAVKSPAGLYKIDAGDKKLVLHIGCDSATKGNRLDNCFKGNDWHEVRLAFDAQVKTDVTAQMGDLSAFSDNQFDAIWLPHKLDRLFLHEVTAYLKQCLRILKTDGYIRLTTPNLKPVCEKVYKQGLETILYKTNGHKITPMDMLFGFGKELAAGKVAIQHRSGFTPRLLLDNLKAAGFLNIGIQVDNYQIWSVSYKRAEITKENQMAKVIDTDVNKMMVERDALDQPVENKVEY